MCCFCEPAWLELNYFNRKIVLTFVLEMQHYDNTLYTENISTNIFFLNNSASSPPPEQLLISQVIHYLESPTN